MPPFILVRLLLLVSCSVRRFRLFLEPPSSVLRRPCQPPPLTWSSIDRRFLPPRFISLRSPLSLPSRHPLFYVLCFTFYVLLLLLFMLDFYGVCLRWFMDFGMYVFGIASMVADRDSPQPTSILAALSSSPTRRLRRRSPLPSPVVVSVVVFVVSVVPLRRLPLGISTLASALVLQPLVLRPSFSSFVELSRGISTVGGGYCHKCRVSPTCGILAVTFVRRSLVFITMME